MSHHLWHVHYCCNAMLRQHGLLYPCEHGPVLVHVHAVPLNSILYSHSQSWPVLQREREREKEREREREREREFVYLLLLSVG